MSSSCESRSCTVLKESKSKPDVSAYSTSFELLIGGNVPIVPWLSNELAGTHILLRAPPLRDRSGRRSASADVPAAATNQAWTGYDIQNVSNPLEFARFLANRVVGRVETGVSSAAISRFTRFEANAFAIAIAISGGVFFVCGRFCPNNVACMRVLSSSIP